MRKAAIALLPLLLLANQACKKDEPPPPPVTAPPVTAPPVTVAAPTSVSAVTLGNAIGADKRVTAPSETFAPKDTIYASVDTAGAGPAKLRALWSFVRGVKTAKVDEAMVEIVPTGPATTEFHISKPSGWPKGDYRVDIFLGDSATPAMTKTFKIG